MKTCLSIAALVVCAGAGAYAAEFGHWNGGRTIPVHRLAPLGFDGEKVSPAAALPAPISQDKTCGQCHDVAAARGGSHFRTGLDTNDAPASVQVEPWFWADEALGLAIPLSLHGQPGAFAPRDLGLAAFEWTKMFGRSFPGGGIGSDPRAMEEVAGPRQRWFVTGPLEANCLACHQQGDAYDSSEWARQVLRENFTGAAVAASGLSAVEGMNERMHGAWAAAENPDDHLFNVPQKIVYDLTQFDAKQRCVFPVGKPQSDRCLACHAVTEKGMPSHAILGDVHLQHGMTCIDCHKNGMDHRIKTTSCRACHIEPKGAGPHPCHAGIPLVHFEKLIDDELTRICRVDLGNTRRLKALLTTLCASVPFQVDISKLATVSGLKRDTVVAYLGYLAKAKLIHLLYSDLKNVKRMQKPDKIYIDNPNLLYAWATTPVQIGTARETFVVNQLAANHTVEYRKTNGDFLVDNRYVFEVGGEDKDFTQIANLPDSYILSDDLETAIGKKLPIWAVGFDY